MMKRTTPSSLFQLGYVGICSCKRTLTENVLFFRTLKSRDLINQPSDMEEEDD